MNVQNKGCYNTFFSESFLSVSFFSSTSPALSFSFELSSSFSSSFPRFVFFSFFGFFSAFSNWNVVVANSDVIMNTIRVTFAQLPTQLHRTQPYKQENHQRFIIISMIILMNHFFSKLEQLKNIMKTVQSTVGALK